ncbi:hypothetical protein [Bacillus sp. FJAT-53711]
MVSRQLETLSFVTIRRYKPHDIEDEGVNNNYLQKEFEDED